MSKKIFRGMVIFTVMILISSLIRAEFPVREGFIDYAGGKTWYKIVGPDRGIPLILVHGGPGVPHFYLESLEGFAINRPVIFYDQRGCGYSDPSPDPANWTIAFYVEELKALVRQLGLRKYHVLGHSCGGMIAAEFALSKPKGLQGLILASPALDMPRIIADSYVLISTLPPEMQDAIYTSINNKAFDSPEYLTAMDEYYKRYLCRTDPWPDYLIQALANTNAEIYSAMNGPSDFVLTGNLKDYNLTPELRHIKVPVLFTCGEFDEVTAETTAYFHGFIKHSKYKMFKDAGHMCHIDQQVQYIKEVQKFLKKVETCKK